MWSLNCHLFSPYVLLPLLFGPVTLCTLSSCQHRLEGSLNSCGHKKSSPRVKISSAEFSTTAITKQFHLPASWQISKWCLDLSVPQSNNSIRRRAQPPCWPSIHLSLQHHHLQKSGSFQCASLALPLHLKLNKTYQTILIETLCYHITFNSTLLQPKIALPLILCSRCFHWAIHNDIWFPEWLKIISNSNYPFHMHMQSLIWCCIIVLCSWVWSVWLVISQYFY